MKKFPLEKYKFIVTNNMVIALSSYAGRVVRGVAKCDPKDTFDVEKGKKLAAARCNEKVCYKRMKRADAMVKEAIANYRHWVAKTIKMLDYKDDAERAYNEAYDELTKLQENM